MPTWTEEAVGDLGHATVLVTGANSGLGLETARALTGAGAHVVMACRDTGKAAEAQADVLAEHPAGRTSIVPLDLSDLHSVRQAAEQITDSHDRLDLCIANAGVMIPPLRRTAQGFELQMGTNHLGHFALVGHLLGLLTSTPDSRVVSVSSMAHRFGSIDLSDLNYQNRSYNRIQAYGSSKLANLLFTSELQRRLSAAGSTTIATAAHPGSSQTDLTRHLPGAGLPLVGTVLQLVGRLLTQSAAMGALPTLRAAVDPDARGDAYYGPDGIGEQMGHPVLVGRSAAARDASTARGLWYLSEELTGVDFNSLEADTDTARP